MSVDDFANKVFALLLKNLVEKKIISNTTLVQHFVETYDVSAKEDIENAVHSVYDIDYCTEEMYDFLETFFTRKSRVNDKDVLESLYFIYDLFDPYSDEMS